jgi:DNA processing protein
MHERGGEPHLPLDGPTFPQRLKALVDPPFGLFCQGDPSALAPSAATPVIAIVGSRRPTAAGVDLCRVLARGLAERGAVIVSGLALGIDAAAHAGALDAGGTTVAVVGCGVDVVYPQRHSHLRSAIMEHGAVVSEYWYGTPPAPWRFPARNRIVAGLADAVVVVEAAERSGALITADFALELGRPVLAVPGWPGRRQSAGCNAMIRMGAAMCESVDDVLAEVPQAAWRAAPPTPFAVVDGVERDLLDLLLREPRRADELCDALSLSAPEVAAALSRLELAGHVVRGDAERFWAAPLRGAA